MIEKKKPPAPAPAYRVLVGLNYPPGRRAEPGDVVTDIPAESVGWLVEAGIIEEASNGNGRD